MNKHRYLLLRLRLYIGVVCMRLHTCWYIGIHTYVDRESVVYLDHEVER